MERIAVIIPAHNRPQMLRRAIRSVLAQVRSPDEFVVIDDGSTENLVGERELVVESGGKWIRLDRTAVGTTHGSDTRRAIFMIIHFIIVIVIIIIIASITIITIIRFVLL